MGWVSSSSPGLSHSPAGEEVKPQIKTRRSTTAATGPDYCCWVFHHKRDKDGRMWSKYLIQMKALKNLLLFPFNAKRGRRAGLDEDSRPRLWPEVPTKTSQQGPAEALEFVFW